MRIPLVTTFWESILREIKPLFHDLPEHQPRSMGVVISTYNNPKWLEKTLWGYLNQRFEAVPYEIIVADDGSTESTRELIARYSGEFPKKIKHIWQPDDGFQKSRILNKAIMAAESEYLVFTDQDCVPRGDFLESHYRHAEPGYFLSGGYVKLPMNASEGLSREEIENSSAFKPSWLKTQYGFGKKSLRARLTESRVLAMFLNAATTTGATCNGCCFSAWHKDLLAVNGFDESMAYGGQDRELGERLVHLGIRGKQLRYSLVCLHLDHARPYADPETNKANWAIRCKTRLTGRVETPFGIRQHPLVDLEQMPLFDTLGR